MTDQLLTHLATSWLWLITSTKPNSCTFLLPVNKASLYHSLVTKDLLQGIDSADLVVQQPVLRVDDVHGGLVESLKHNMVADFLFTWEKKEGNWKEGNRIVTYAYVSSFSTCRF